MATDPSQLKPVPIQKTLLLVNNFIINTCSFLDAFADKCDTSLSKLRDRISELEILTVVLEAKLNSIPDLEEVGGETTSRPAAPAATTTAPANAPPVAPGAPPGPPAPAAPGAEESMALVAVPDAGDDGDPSTIAVMNHPHYKKYFKMMSMGIPVPATKMKAAAEGFNPDLLDTPEARIPNDVPPEE